MQRETDASSEAITDLPDEGVDTIAKVALRARRVFGAEEALVDGERRLTFAEYVDRAFETARALLAAGIELGDRIAVWAPNSIDYAVLALGIHCAGGVLVPVNTRFKPAEVQYVLDQARPQIAFGVRCFLGTAYTEVLSELTGDHVTLSLESDDPGFRAFLDAGARHESGALEERLAAIGPDHIGTILFTSGTTGRAKGAMLRHKALVRAYWSFSSVAGMRRGDRVLCSNPFFHAFGLKVGLLSALMQGAAIHPLAVFDTEEVLELIERERITYYPGPPTVFQSLLTSPDLATRDISSLRSSVIGATTIVPQLVFDLYDQLGFEEVHSPYGFTEGTGVATVTRASDPREVVATTAGRALPGITVEILRPDGSAAGLEEVGEIVVSGYNRMAGYLDPESGTPQPDASADRRLFSGDLGTLDERGNLVVRGRIKDMYIAGGFNVYPAEVEACILSHPEVASAAVVGMPDERLGEVGCAFVVSAATSPRVDESSVIAWCRDRLANFKVPRRVVVVDALPLNATGKVAKTELSRLLPS